MARLSRRAVLAGVAASLAPRSAIAFARDSGALLYADVVRYERFGDHRTGSPGDRSSARWIAARLERLGFAATLQPFAHDLFEPHISVLDAGARAAPVFPLWPVRETPAHGVRGPLIADRPAGPGEIALVGLPYAPNASLAARSYRDPLLAAASRAPAAVIGITEGPTGESIALNVPADLESWPMPIALIGPRESGRLTRTLPPGRDARLRLTGLRRRVEAHNVLAHRPGHGPALVVSTPISGWRGCAGERGAGIALFLALADHLAPTATRPLVFIATSGHEFEGQGSRIALPALPPPEDVAAWIHIGANVAGAAVAFEVGAPRRTERAHGPRGVGATASLIASVRQAYDGLEAYAPPVLLASGNAVGDLAHYLEAGYSSLMGLVGAHPLHHTRLDTAALATSPTLLAQALRPLLQVARGLVA